MWVGEIITAKSDDLSVTLDGGVVVLSAVLPEQTLHQPGLRQRRRNIENSIEKDLRDFPTFFGNGPRRMSTIDADNRMFSLWFGPRFCGRFEFA